MSTVLHPTSEPWIFEQLHDEMAPGGDTVYTVLRHVSRSGMFRRISLVVIVDGRPIDISYRAAAIMGWAIDTSDHSIRVTGAGMDMGFHLVYALSRTLHDDGYALHHKWL